MTSQKNKAILFVMPRFPFPTVSGRKTSLYHYCRILSEELGYRLIVAAFQEHGDDPAQKPYFIDRLVILKKPSRFEKVKNVLFKSLLTPKFPLQVSLYLCNKAKSQINDLVQEENPIAVIADMVRCTEYIKEVNSFRIADLDDRISLRYKRQLDTDIDNVNPYGAFLDTLPGFVKKIALFKPIKLAVLRKEINLLNFYELEIGKICEKTIFVAQGEADNFNHELGDVKAIAVPIGVDVDYFYPKPIEKKANEISFLGAMNVAHNENAAIHFIDNIFPLVQKKLPDATFRVIGGGVSQNLNERASGHVFFTGRVKDVRDFLAQSKVFVCPMLFGSGIKTKILEAMSMGLPTVTTTVGAENINAIDEVDWFVEDEDQAFADKVIAILTDEQLESKISKTSREFILSNFTWDVAKGQLDRILKNV